MNRYTKESSLRIGRNSTSFVTFSLPLLDKMRTTLLSLFFASLCVASPLGSVGRRQIVNDIDVLNYALTLEHIESAFYRGGLEKYDAEAFEEAGFPDDVRARFVEIAEHEASHVEFLTAAVEALGGAATQPCQYNFLHTDPRTFALLSQILESVGTSAYTGAARLISNKDYLTDAASILATEARHASWVASAANKVSPWSGPFEAALMPAEVVILVLQYITLCPSSNPPLPVTVFPSLIFTSKPIPGHTTIVEQNPTTSPATHVSFLTGLDKILVPIADGQVRVPEGLSGTVYAVATKSGKGATDDTIIAGPAVLLFEGDSTGNLIN
ncbi:unnamed protein product [Cyclocybe aegerita]|uniref:Uncharacterized protein n=1 Tax=Cyclocybe aegerita TaxID=1973307 RepID=A0A8S0XFA3_CYCAE|nr:unnamed protein product [Cyclocybe aegerita]